MLVVPDSAGFVPVCSPDGSVPPELSLPLLVVPGSDEPVSECPTGCFVLLDALVPGRVVSGSAALVSGGSVCCPETADPGVSVSVFVSDGASGRDSVLPAKEADVSVSFVLLSLPLPVQPTNVRSKARTRANNSILL